MDDAISFSPTAVVGCELLHIREGKLRAATPRV
jgi:hypothetical protein